MTPSSKTREDHLICPECETENEEGAAICVECRQPLDAEAIEEHAARRRHPTGRGERRAARQASRQKNLPGRRRSADEPAGLSEKVKAKVSRNPPEPAEAGAIVWYARMPTKDRVQREIPNWSYGWITRRRLVYVGVALIVLAAMAALIAQPDRTQVGQAKDIGLTFRYGPEWTDIAPRGDWTSRFSLAPSVVEDGASTDLAIERGDVALAVVDFEPETETVSPELIASRVNGIKLLFDLSPDSRVGSSRQINLYGKTAYSVTGERIVNGEKRQEEVIVTERNGREVYLMMSAPSSKWKEARETIDQVIKSAE